MENQPQDHLNQVQSLETTSSETTQPRIQALETLYPICEKNNFPQNLINTLRNHLTPDIQAQLTSNPSILQDPPLQELFAKRLLPKLNADPEYLQSTTKKKNPDGSPRTIQIVMNELIAEKIQKLQ
jgi:hypothetical protein